MELNIFFLILSIEKVNKKSIFLERNSKFAESEKKKIFESRTISHLKVND
jgi:hypothetical protein